MPLSGFAAAQHIPTLTQLVRYFCVCQVLTLPTFPTSVMGTVVNKRAKYSYLRLVQNNEKLTYRCVLDLQESGQHAQHMPVSTCSHTAAQEHHTCWLVAGTEAVEQQQGLSTHLHNNIMPCQKSCCCIISRCEVVCWRQNQLRAVLCLSLLMPACSCSLNPNVGSTFSGHAEFELVLEAVSHDKGAASGVMPTLLQERETFGSHSLECR
jgi:hypothetical protein